MMAGNPPIFLARKWVIFLLAAVYVVFAAYYLPSLHNWIGILNERPLGGDFTNLWFAARLTMDGQISLLFDHLGFWNAQSNFFGQEIEIHNWSYPPHFIPWLLWLGFLPYGVALGLWSLLTFAFYAVMVVYKRPAPWTLTAVLALAPSSAVNIFYGQTGFLMAAFLVGGLRLRKTRPILAGVLFGFLTFKPQLGLLLPVALLAGRDWRVIFAAVTTTLVLVGISVACFGIDPWRIYLQETISLQRHILEAFPDQIYSNMMTSPFMAVRLLGGSIGLAYGITAIAACGAAGVVAYAFYRPIAPEIRNALLLTATFLFSPYMFSYDLTALSAAIIAMFVVAGRRLVPDDRTLLCVAWALPLLVLKLNMAGLPVAPFVCVGLIWLQLRWAKASLIG